MDKPALATGPAKRTLSNTVASLAIILDLLAYVVAAIESSGKQRIKRLVLVNARHLNNFADTVRACRRTANSSQELKDTLFTGIDLAETTIAQLRKALAPPHSQSITGLITLRFRWLFRARRHFTYTAFYQQSEQVLAGLEASRQWIFATPLRRRVPLPEHLGVAPLSNTPATASDQTEQAAVSDADQPNDAVPSSSSFESPFVAVPGAAGAIEYNPLVEGEEAELTSTTPRRWSTREATNAPLGYVMMPAKIPPPPNTVRKRHNERGVGRWPIPNAESPTPPVDPTAESDAG